MNRTLLFTAAATLAAMTGSAAGPAAAADMGDTAAPIRLAINEWTGQHVSTHVGGEILRRAGYRVEYVTAGYMNMYQAMADGDLTAALEVWTSNVSDQFAELEKAGKLVDIAGLGLDAKEGFAYPAHVAEICPGLPAWEALKACAGAFATAETLPMGRLLDYPADWGTPGADRIAGLKLPFKAVPAGSEGALITELRAAHEKKSPLIMLFWQPHWAMAAYDVKFVALPAAEPGCFEDKSWGVNPDAINDCDFAPTRIFKAGWAGIEKTWPAAFQILRDYKLTTEQQQPMIGAVDVDGKPVEAVAAAFLDANPSVWKPIVDAATR